MRVGFICSSRKCESPDTVPIFDVAAFMADDRRGRRAAARDRERREARGLPRRARAARRRGRSTSKIDEQQSLAVKVPPTPGAAGERDRGSSRSILSQLLQLWGWSLERADSRAERHRAAHAQRRRDARAAPRDLVPPLPFFGGRARAVRDGTVRGQVYCGDGGAPNQNG